MSPPAPPVLVPAAGRGSVIYLKLAGIAFLILLLHVPLLLTYGVLSQRRDYRRQATDEIAAAWGRCQTLTGPVLAVPYARATRVTRAKLVNGRSLPVDETEWVPARAYFLPETLAVQGQVEPETRHRGLFEAVVYSTTLRLTGRFRPDFAAVGIAADRIEWDKARVLFGVADLQGLRALGPLRLGTGREAAFAPADAGEFLALAAPVEGVTAGGELRFTLDTTLQGSDRLEVVPVGKRTTVLLAARWPDPSFCGACLPVKHATAGGRFRAEWTASYLNRGFPQSWTSAEARAAVVTRMDGAAFGVAFARPVDGYRLVERAEKYGLLFFVLVFAAFFLFEVTAALRIHWLQYALVGAGLCLFFLGFLALSEFMNTSLAYGIAAAACTALISIYAWSFLRTGRRTLVIAGGLVATYGYLYFVLQSQDYALLAGTVALFAALALVMYCTRRVNWYTLELDPAPPSTGAGPR